MSLRVLGHYKHINNMKGLTLLSAVLFSLAVISCGPSYQLRKLKKEINKQVEDFIADDPTYKPGGEYYEGRNAPPKWLPSEIEVGDTLALTQYEVGGFSYWEDSLARPHCVDSIITYRDGTKMLVLGKKAKIFLYPGEKWEGIAFFDEYAKDAYYNEEKKVGWVRGKEQLLRTDVYNPMLWKGNVSFENHHYHPEGYRVELRKH
jgi:hypothetical protein